MPKQIRYSIKQSLQSAVNEATRCGQKLVQIHSLINPEHPDIGAQIQVIIDTEALVVASIQSLEQRI